VITRGSGGIGSAVATSRGQVGAGVVLVGGDVAKLVAGVHCWDDEVGVTYRSVPLTVQEAPEAVRTAAAERRRMPLMGGD
jgi:NAD(P)-dependent dehydrogenase (short-subunit alcohol dehydrogenase family)